MKIKQLKMKIIHYFQLWAHNCHFSDCSVPGMLGEEGTSWDSILIQPSQTCTFFTASCSCSPVLSSHRARAAILCSWQLNHMYDVTCTT